MQVLYVLTDNEDFEREKSSLKYNFIKLKVINYANLKEVLSKENFDIVIFSYNILIEKSIALAQYVLLTTPSSAIILLEKEVEENLIDELMDIGILWLKLPYQENEMINILKLAFSMVHRNIKLYKENANLLVQMDTMRIIARAKCLMIERKNFNEEQAHHFIEHRAMNLHISKRQVAERIIEFFLA